MKKFNDLELTRFFIRCKSEYGYEHAVSKTAEQFKLPQKKVKFITSDVISKFSEDAVLGKNVKTVFLDTK